MGWADEVGSGVKNVTKYLKYYTSNAAEPLFFEDDVFRTRAPLIIYTLSKNTDAVLELLGVKKNDLDQKLFESIQSIEILSMLVSSGKK